MCTSLYMMVMYDRARVGPTTKTSNEISIICLFRLILQVNPLFLFSVVVFELHQCLNLDSIPFVNGVLILRCGYQSFMIIEIVMPILSNRRALFFQVDPFISTFARSILSSLQRCLLHPSQVAFVFPPSQPFS